ncbi:hypothetical protein HPB52_000830 [Rhipicephalus sanguineus]|uniref:CCHC-type domain-containing protein n=1 Tax=Rhipicephalus sanguineus TaxID=34632 RepID=A0A9D4PTB2_RHISA|nr:hypothetical protein HPB52_000830 [Rhipicephalus sanguineus]
MDVTATSRKRGREEDAAEGPRKQASTHATAATATTAAAAPAASPSMRDDAASLTATPAVLLSQAASAGIVAAPSSLEGVAATRKRRKNKRKTRSKRRWRPREFVPSAAEPRTASRPLNTTVAEPRPSPPPSEDDFVTVVSKAAQRRARALETAAVTTDHAIVGTVLYRPSAPGGSFIRSPRLTLASALAKRPGVLAVRVNHRRNIVAADASACLSELLTIKELGGVPVTAREPADRRASTGYVYGAVPVLSATREGATVKLRFAEPLPPELVVLHGLRLRVRHVRPRPSQCQKCGRFGHVAEACMRIGDCLRCGRRHPEAESCKPRCISCGGAHTATNPTCPRWQEERRVVTLLATSSTPLSRRAVTAAVREETREVRSYAAAVKTTRLENNTTDRGLQRPTPAPRRSRLPALTSATVDEPADPPTTPAEDPRDALIATLLATLQAVARDLPEEHPLRATCLQAIGARPGAPRGETPDHLGCGEHLLQPRQLRLLARRVPQEYGSRTRPPSRRGGARASAHVTDLCAPAPFGLPANGYRLRPRSSHCRSVSLVSFFRVFTRSIGVCCGVGTRSFAGALDAGTLAKCA